MGLKDSKNTKIKNYSLGMIQRLGIAQAIMEEPSILLLDESFNSMDEEGVKEIRDLIKNYVKKKATVLLTSHNREDIKYLSDKILKLENGTFCE